MVGRRLSMPRAATRNVTLLGATGSIGASTLDVIARHPERYRVFAATAHQSGEAMLELCRRHRPRLPVRLRKDRLNHRVRGREVDPAGGADWR